MPRLVADGLQESVPSSSAQSDQPAALLRQSPIVGPGPPPGLPPASQQHVPQFFRYDNHLSFCSASPSFALHTCIPCRLYFYMRSTLVYHDGYTFTFKLNALYHSRCCIEFLSLQRTSKPFSTCCYAD